MAKIVAKKMLQQNIWSEMESVFMETAETRPLITCSSPWLEFAWIGEGDETRRLDKWKSKVRMSHTKS
jgi:hypothetical protein